ncbi:MAG: hypothetical protein ACXW6K_13650 [Candidatus Binatia bacterium]
MNQSIDKRLNALEARLLSPAIVTKPSMEGFDVDEYQRVMLEFTSRDARAWEWSTHFREWSRDQQGKQKVSIFGKGWVLL